MSFRGPRIPSRSDVEQWLRANVRKKTPSRIAQWFGAPKAFHYGIGDPILREMPFFTKHCIFAVFGERELLPFSSLPSGSWGLFATDGVAISLLKPNDDSLDRLFRAEGRPLHEATPQSLAQFTCDVRFCSGGKHHVVVADSEAVQTYGGDDPMGRYVVNDREFDRVCDDIVQPMILTRPEGGWQIMFTSLFGWMHELQDLGIELIDISLDFHIVARRRKQLSKQIFSLTPCVLY